MLGGRARGQNLVHIQKIGFFPSSDSDSDNWRRDGRPTSPRGGFLRRGVRGGLRGRGGRGRGRGRPDVDSLTGTVSRELSLSLLSYRSIHKKP